MDKRNDDRDLNRDRDLDRDRDLTQRGTKNEIEGSAKELEGKVRGDVGDAVDDGSEHLKGRAKEMEGKVQKKFGQAEQDLGDKR